jgi:hypothetical protein
METEAKRSTSASFESRHPCEAAAESCSMMPPNSSKTPFSEKW